MADILHTRSNNRRWTMLTRFVGYSMIAAALLPVQSASALVITTYSDRTSWEAAAGGFAVETFDSTPDTYFSNTDLTIGLTDFSIAVDPTDHGFLSRGIVGGLLIGDIHGSPAASLIPRFMAFNFFQSFDAFAMDLFGVGNDCVGFGCNGGVTVATLAGPDLSISFNLSAGTPFFGFVADGTRFDSLVLTKLSVLGTDNRDGFG